MAHGAGDGDGAGAGWEDAIDVDDSDLPSLFSQPPPSSLRPCSSSRTLAPDPAAIPAKSPAAHRLIPGPAGTVQTAMLRRSAAQPMEAGTTPDNGVRVDLRYELDEDDGDFKLNPWLCAVNSLGKDNAASISIGSIKNCRGGVERVPQVMGIVKSCVPNGLGDLFITLKDRSGIIGASVHRRVLKEGNLGGDLSVGCVLILKQVVVFCATRSTCYLNITLNNVVKLIGTDCGPPPEQLHPPFSARCDVSENCMESPLRAADRVLSIRQGTENIVADEVRRNATNERIIGSRTAEGLATGLANNVNAPAATFNMAARADNRASEPKRGISKEPVAQWSNAQGAQKENNDEARTTMMNLEKLLHGRTAQATEHITPSMPCGLSTTVEVTNIATKPATRTTEPKKQISGGSVAPWTDEQLAELFADYQDDSEFRFT